MPRSAQLRWSWSEDYPYFSSSVAFWFLRLQRRKILFLEHENRYPLFSGSCSSLRPGLVPDLLFRFTQTVRKIATAETSEIAVASHRLEISTPSPIGSVAIGSVPKKAIHNRWMTAVVVSEMNRRSPRAGGVRKNPTRSASG